MTRIIDCDQLPGGSTRGVATPGHAGIPPQDECPGDWEKLPPAGERDIRVCPVCLKAVYRCTSAEEARLRAEAGHRAALGE